MRKNTAAQQPDWKEPPRNTSVREGWKHSLLNNLNPLAAAAVKPRNAGLPRNNCITNFQVTQASALNNYPKKEHIKELANIRANLKGAKRHAKTHRDDITLYLEQVQAKIEAMKTIMGDLRDTDDSASEGKGERQPVNATPMRPPRSATPRSHPKRHAGPL